MVYDRQRKPKLILLCGAAGVGKTSLGELYIKDHPLSFCIEGDKLITMIGQWYEHESEARNLVFVYTKALARVHLAAGHNVVITSVPTNAGHISEFEQLAEDLGATFIEVLLHTTREDAIERLLKRGTWGEEGLPPLSQADMPVIEDLYDRMAEELKKRPGAVRIDSVDGAIDETYGKLLAVVDAV